MKLSIIINEAATLLAIKATAILYKMGQNELVKRRFNRLYKGNFNADMKLFKKHIAEHSKDGAQHHLTSAMEFVNKMEGIKKEIIASGDFRDIKEYGRVEAMIKDLKYVIRPD